MKQLYNIVYPNTKPDYIGLKIQDKIFKFVFPCNYEKAKTEEELKKDMLNLLVVIDKYKNLQTINDNHKQEYSFPFSIYLWMIEDYLKNGYYVSNEKEFINRNNGKIDWKRTIKNNDVFLNSKNLIYKSFIVHHNKNNVENMLTNIHKFCVLEAIQKMGWFYSLSPNIADRNYEKYSKNIMLNILRKSYNHSYIDSKKTLISNMIKLIEGLDENNFDSKTFDVSTTEFEYVFERLIEERFGNVDVKDYYPIGIWHIDKKTYNSSHLRPDTIMIKDDNAYVIDAKYYNYGYSKDISDLPDTSSIQKQITYAEELKSKRKDLNNIYNIFLLPTSSNSLLEYIGYADTSWKDTNETYEKVYAFLVDLKMLVNNSLNKKEIYQELLLEQVKNVSLLSIVGEVKN